MCQLSLLNFFLRACNNGQWLIIVAGAADISGVSRVSQIFLWVLAKMEVTVQTILAAYIGCTEYKFIKYTLSLHNPTKLNVSGPTNADGHNPCLDISVINAILWG